MVDYTWILKLLIEIEAFASLNRLYGLRDRVSRSCDALLEDVAQKPQNDVRTRLRWEVEDIMNLDELAILERKVLQFPIGGRRSIKLDAEISQAIGQSVYI